MALADEFDDDYRRRVNSEFPSGPIVGPMDQGGFPAPAASPKPGGYDLEGFRQRWMQSGNVNDPNAWLQGNQDITSGVTLKGEKAYDPSGRFIADLVGNYSGGDPSGRSRIFLDGIGSNGLPRTATPARTTTTRAKGLTTAAMKPAANPFLTDIRKLIMDQLAGLKGTPSIDDPALAAQSQAYRRSTQRGVADERAMLAERAAANGLLQGGQSSGGFDTAVQGAIESGAERNAANDAQLVGDEVESRRATMQGLLNMALQSGDAEMTRTLQMELAKLDAQLRREGLAQQGDQFNQSLAQNRYFHDDTMGYNLGRSAEDDYRYRVNLGLGV